MSILCTFLSVRALTAVQEVRLEARRKRMTFYPDAGHAVSRFLR